MLRDISGNIQTVNNRHTLDDIARNQKIHVQPAAYDKAPPRIGPPLGAILLL